MIWPVRSIIKKFQAHALNVQKRRHEFIKGDPDKAFEILTKKL
jgi:hypothetical protein